MLNRNRKGHVFHYNGETLCGESGEVLKSALYSMMCGDCVEVAGSLLKGRHLKYKTVDIETEVL